VRALSLFLCGHNKNYSLTDLKARLANKPYLLFLPAGIVLIAVTVFTSGQTVDFHLHDTYFVISSNYLFWALGLLFFIAWIIYILTGLILWSKKLIWVHVSTTLFVLLLLASIIFWHDEVLPPIKRDATSLADIMDEQRRERIIGYSVVAIFAIGQAAYVVNLIVGLLKRRQT
jgi:hypothetical protein